MVILWLKVENIFAVGLWFALAGCILRVLELAELAGGWMFTFSAPKLIWAQAVDSETSLREPLSHSNIMAPAMKVMKAKKVAMKAMKGQKAMTKGGLTGSLADATEIKKADIAKVLNSLAEIGTEEVKKSGKFILPGLCMIKTRQKPATKAGKKLMFGKEVMVKAQPAKTVVKAFPVAALKREVWGHGSLGGTAKED